RPTGSEHQQSAAYPVPGYPPPKAAKGGGRSDESSYQNAASPGGPGVSLAVHHLVGTLDSALYVRVLGCGGVISMAELTVVNLSKGTCLGTRIRLADGFWARLRGLLGVESLPKGEGLLLRPCQMVHGIGMRFSIEAVYLDSSGRVIGIHLLEPGR